MGWATPHIARLQDGETVSFRPRGHSMAGVVDDGQLVTVAPLADDAEVARRDVVLCKVRGRQYLHLVIGVRPGEVQIGNARGGVNGWTRRSNVYGRMVT